MAVPAATPKVPGESGRAQVPWEKALLPGIAAVVGIYAGAAAVLATDVAPARGSADHVALSSINSAAHLLDLVATHLSTLPVAA
ncbi:MAG: hypothetical protein NVS4B10_09200 [Myxococcales bacterium]